MDRQHHRLFDTRGLLTGSLYRTTQSSTPTANIDDGTPRDRGQIPSTAWETESEMLLADEPMILDAFDEQLLRNHEYSFDLDSNPPQGQCQGEKQVYDLRQDSQMGQEGVYHGQQDRQLVRQGGWWLPQPEENLKDQDDIRYAPTQALSTHGVQGQLNLSQCAFRAGDEKPALFVDDAFTRTSFSDDPGHHPAHQRENWQIEPEQTRSVVSAGHGARVGKDYDEVMSMRPRNDSVLDRHQAHGSSVTNRSIGSVIANATPIVHGIPLVSTRELPDRLRAIFPFPLFNAVQSKSFGVVYMSDDNFVLSAPTGSGKTAVLELAICRLVNRLSNGSFKIVYQAPTKSLCSERQRDWQTKFGPLDLQVAELTGDTENSQLQNVQNASIIVTTPEKWDSITRKWKDHRRLMQMVKLFLVDEVHMLKDDRGATLEAVVSRMKSIGTDVRFVALSATVPNLQDIATWLGKDSVNKQIPAPREKFGEEFRPVQLSKQVCGYQSQANDYAFDKTLNAKLPDVIAKWSRGKPIMVFCFTRASCIETAKILAEWWTSQTSRERCWAAPTKQISFESQALYELVSTGVAFHHAGLPLQDRNKIEKAYLEGDINVICCTSTLAVGVNLPCHMAIIKGTITYNGKATKEYSDLEIMQMLGRAGRPQFDTDAVAVIMTRMARLKFYQKLISGQEVLESCLHKNLIEHLNAEISLGTIHDIESAKTWLSGTFLYVRLKDNPGHYDIDGDAPGQSLEERVERICRKNIKLLQESDLVQNRPKLQCTDFGDTMARCYIQYETMKVFLGLPPKAKISEILSAVASAAEFTDIRFRQGEKTQFKNLNKHATVKFPIPVNIDLPVHKVLLIIQSVLGAVDFKDRDNKKSQEFMTAQSTIFQHLPRLIRCIIDCKLEMRDAVSVRNALMLARSFGAQVWDDSPLHMKQLQSIGDASVRKLVAANIKSIEDLTQVEPHKIEAALSRNPPQGKTVQDFARAFPSLRISMKVTGEPVVKRGVHVTIKVIAEIGFLNESPPRFFNQRPVFVCLLVETSDGDLVHFIRISARKIEELDQGRIFFNANLRSPSQTLRGYIMCDNLAGTQRSVLVKPAISAALFATVKRTDDRGGMAEESGVVGNTGVSELQADGQQNDEFSQGIADADLVLASTERFVDIDDFASDEKDTTPRVQEVDCTNDETQTVLRPQYRPTRLENGRWQCNHRCRGKGKCKHACCRDGLDKPPKPPKSKAAKSTAQDPLSTPRQTQLNVSISKPAPTQSAGPAKDLPDAPLVEKPRPIQEPLSGIGQEQHKSPNGASSTIITTTHQATASTALPSALSSTSGWAFREAARKVDNTPPSDYGMSSVSSDDLLDMTDIFNPTQRPRKDYLSFATHAAFGNDGKGDGNDNSGSDMLDKA